MARNNNLILIRNKNVKTRFNELSNKYPRWKYDALLDSLSLEFYISKRTITAILNNEGRYSTAI